MDAKIDAILASIDALRLAVASLRDPGEVSLNFEEYKKCILVTGDTKPVKDLLKSHKAKWNPTLKGWVMTPENAELAKVAIYGNKE